MFKSLLFCLGAFGLRFGPAVAQNFNRPVPPAVPKYEFYRSDTADYGCYLLAPFRIGGGPNAPKSIAVLDAAGYVVWYMPVNGLNALDFKFDPVQQRYTFIRFVPPQSTQFIVLNADFEPLDTFYTAAGVDPDPHEFSATAGHTFLLSGVKDSVMDLSGYTFNGQQGSAQTTVTGFVVQEFSAGHELLFQWNSNDHIHPAQTYDHYGYIASAFDYCHGNSISEDSDGDLLLSMRHLNAVYKVDRKTGQVRWQLGGKSSSFTFPDDWGFSGQHDAQRLPNGHISVFDNGNMTVPLPFSRAVEYALDTVSWQAHKVWECTKPLVLSPALGNHQTTAGRLHLINYGLVYRPDPTFQLVNDDKVVLSRLMLQDSFMTYRAFLADLPLGNLLRPEVSCMADASGLVLSAPPGYARYVWSTGANTQSIAVTQPGTYQVWVTQGAGMLGSLPVQVDHPDTYCVPDATDIPPETGAPVPIAYYDLLGRPVRQPQQGQLYVIRYSDGQSRLRFYAG